MVEVMGEQRESC